ncbi:MAG: hypothetical protein A2Z78_00215 [Candidatus Nealsonbacteria bacterium RBG_13_36_15]|uniref:Peptidase M60 domain-containing protein n=1 Tax=Candidatus Nealsonbacteria bacterium RBG_13_36_15 TaxID=1801660 RepID=A0A1G2DWH1_9BACT|nr:MAG: hypothetical protein A2Z78_00215 [Candidatus Nealsonbacteria bacterium RBG_13_36_15]
MENFKFYNRGQVLFGIIFTIVIVSLISGGLYYYLEKKMPKMPEIIEKPVGEKTSTPPPETSEGELTEEEKIIPEKEPSEVHEPEVPCQSECSQTGLKKCSNNGYQTCGNYDEDNCSEWSSIINCPSNNICQDGKCIQRECADGTSYSQCSTTKPKYCNNGSLINKCSACGCPSGQQCQGDESCIVSSFNFNLSVNPASGSTTQGGTISTAVNATLSSGIPQSVTFSASNLPASTSASFNPSSCIPSCSSIMTITTSSTTPTGTYPITITVGSKETIYNLTVTGGITSLLLNPGFENGSGNMPTSWQKDYWSVTRSTWNWISDGSTVKSGMGAAKITSSQPNDAAWLQNVSVDPYSSYLFKGWIKAENVTLADPPNGFSTGANLSVHLSLNRSPGIWGTQNWTEESLFFCSIASSSVKVAARIGYNWSLTTGTVYFDDISLEKLDPPFIGQKTVLCFLPEHRSILTNPSGWLQKLDAAYSALQDLTGQIPYDGNKVVTQEVVSYPGGELIAGNPTLWYTNYVPNTLQQVNNYNYLGFGQVHELSHAFDFYGSHYAGNGPINPEHWANFKLTYVADILSATYPTATFSHPTQGFIPIGDFPYEYFVVRYAQPWIDSGRTDWQNMSNDVYTGLLYLLKEDIGWEPFKQTFRDYASVGSPPATDLEKVELFAHLLSANAGVDVTPYFQGWGFPILPP